MLIDNNLATSKFKMAYIISGILSVAAFVFIYFDKPHTHSLIILGIVFAALHFLLLLLIQPSYFSICDDDDPIVVCKYNAYPLFRRGMSFSIKKQLLYSYTIDKHLFGLRKSLTITIRGYNRNNQMQDYVFPVFNISAMSRDDIAMLEKMLNKYINANLERLSKKK